MCVYSLYWHKQLRCDLFRSNYSIEIYFRSDIVPRIRHPGIRKSLQRLSSLNKDNHPHCHRAPRRHCCTEYCICVGEFRIEWISKSKKRLLFIHCNKQILRIQYIFQSCFFRGKNPAFFEMSLYKASKHIEDAMCFD